MSGLPSPRPYPPGSPGPGRQTADPPKAPQRLQGRGGARLAREALREGAPLTQNDPTSEAGREGDSAPPYGHAGGLDLPTTMGAHAPRARNGSCDSLEELILTSPGHKHAAPSESIYISTSPHHHTLPRVQWGG